jgi:nucleoside-diphosphate-sugar epimerase
MAQGHEVHVLDAERTQPRLEKLAAGLKRHLVDLNDHETVRMLVSHIRPECAIHLAWYTMPGKYWTAPENLECVTASLRLAEALVFAGCRRLTGVGSCAEYDWRYGYLSESHTPLRPSSLYGAAKNALRQILEARLALAGMEFAWARLFYLYGPGESAERLVPSAILGLLNGTGFRCTRGDFFSDFLHVEDAAGAICSLAVSPVTGAVNIASGLPTRIRDLVTEIAQIVGRAEGLEFAPEQQDSESRFLVADTNRLAREVGWRPRFDLSARLRQTCDWWKAQKEPSITGTAPPCCTHSGSQLAD